MTALRTDKFIKSLEKSDHHHHHEQQQHFCARHQGDSRRDPLTPALAILCLHGLFAGLPGPRSPRACPCSPFPRPQHGLESFRKEDERAFSEGLPLAMLNPSSPRWQGASHWQLLPHPLAWVWGHPLPSMAPGFLCVTQTLATLGILSFWI